jgi:succinate-acetate transporter protein
MSEAKAAEWANPAPAGLISLSVAVFMFYAMFSGSVNAPGCFPIMGFWLLGAFVVQIVTALIELKKGNLNGGNVFLFFSAFFCFTTGSELIFKYFAIVNQWAPAYDGRVDGWSWLALGIALIPITICYLKKSPLSMNLMVLSLDFAVIFIVGMDLGIMDQAVYAPIAAYGCLSAGIFALYTVSAMFLNSNFERAILPMPGPMIK